MGFRIAIGTRSDEFRDIDIYDDLDEAMDVLNELINRQNFQEPDSVVSLFNTSSGEKMAQYALQDFNYSQDGYRLEVRSLSNRPSKQFKPYQSHQ